jgi:hypothetical protein
LIVVVPVAVLVGMTGSALTGRISRHSTTGLAVVPAAGLLFAQLDKRIGHCQPQLGCERGVVGAPVGEEGTWA